MTKGKKISDKVASFGGSWFIIILFGVILFLWIWQHANFKREFDPYPFILMNLILSCIAAFKHQ
jgi:uncharacterized membrane protein